MSVPTVAGLLEGYADGTLRVADVVDEALERADGARASHNAFVHLDVERARQHARDLDLRTAARGRRGRLHGVPVAVKDVIDVEGLAVTAGSRHFERRIALRDAPSVAALRREGAVVIGTTTTHELAYGPTGDRSATGPVANPADAGRMSGGSSGGSAAAVALGVVPLALGTDTGGSVRVPAALSGVVGMKPTRGLLTTEGVMPLSRSLDHLGLLATDVDGVVRALDALDAVTVPPGPFAMPVRAGWLRDGFADHVDPAVVDVVERWAQERLGEADAVEVPRDLVDRLRTDYAAIQGAEAYALHERRVREQPHLFDTEVLERLRGAAEVPAWQYVRALERRADLLTELESRWPDLDVLAMPTTPIDAPAIDQRSVRLGVATAGVRDLLLSATSPFNVLGSPAVSLPVPGPHGLPVGLQLVGRHGGDADLLAAARAMVAAAPEPRGQEPPR